MTVSQGAMHLLTTCPCLQENLTKYHTRLHSWACTPARCGNNVMLTKNTDPTLSSLYMCYKIRRAVSTEAALPSLIVIPIPGCCCAYFKNSESILILSYVYMLSITDVKMICVQSLPLNLCLIVDVTVEGHHQRAVCIHPGI
jgi:hypothetical protein